jgi:hypothetical protein
MPASEYKKYYLISRPHFNETIRVWLPYASVTADGDGREFYYHQFKELNSTFETEEQALSFGFIVARAWVDEQLWQPLKSTRAG